jgi:hypothetical protein
MLLMSHFPQCLSVWWLVSHIKCVTSHSYIVVCKGPVSRELR